VTKESVEKWMFYLTTRRDSNSGSNVFERRGSMETKVDGEVQSKDLAFAVATSTDDCNNYCCIQRMTVTDLTTVRCITSLVYNNQLTWS